MTLHFYFPLKFSSKIQFFTSTLYNLKTNLNLRVVKMVCSKLLNKFCAICGMIVFAKQKRALTDAVKDLYRQYFSMEIGEVNAWTPNTACSTCVSSLRNWFHGRTGGKLFATPMIWRQVESDHSNCYFCRMPSLNGITTKNKSKLCYPQVNSIQFPVEHSILYPVPISPSETVNEAMDIDDDDLDASCDCNTDPDFVCPEIDDKHRKFSQSESDDLIRDLELPKEKSELLVSRLKERNFVDESVKITKQRKREEDYIGFFSEYKDFVACNDVDGLLKSMGIDHKPEEWRLFLDSSKHSFKVILLHNGNELPSIPLAYSTVLKECYNDVKKLLIAIDYRKHNWIICSDLKMVAILLGLQLGYTTYCCYLCLWKSRAKDKHYEQKVWPKRTTFVKGKFNVKFRPLVKPGKVIPPPLHIKLGTFSSFVKGMKHDSKAFQHLSAKFPAISEAKMEQGVLVGPQIRKLVKDETFEKLLIGPEKKAWQSFKKCCSGFFGNHRASNFRKLVSNLVNNLKKMKVNMSPKIHYLDSHLDSFPANCGQFSDEHGERMHQDMASFEKRYQGRVGCRTLAEFCWFQIRNDPSAIHKRQAKKKSVVSD